MTKRERVQNAIDLKDVDFVPSLFSLHFPKEVAKGDAAVKAHLDYFKDAETDILKIMNENMIPYHGDFKTYDDYSMIGKISMETPYMKDQIDLTKRILDKKPDDCYVIGTLHGICASGLHPVVRSGYTYEQARDFQAGAVKSNNQKAYDAFKRIADGMSELAEAYIKAGVDGIYYAALGGEPGYYTDEEFEKWIKPFDCQILSACKSAGGTNFLHICKEKVDLNRYTSYCDLIDVVNWGVYEIPWSLEDGKKCFPNKTIMGGLANRSGVIVNGSEDDITKAVHNVIQGFGKKGFILGADCTLATEQNMDLVRAAVRACRTI